MTKNFNIKIEDVQLKRLKQYCIDNDMTMTQVVKDMIDGLSGVRKFPVSEKKIVSSPSIQVVPLTSSITISGITEDTVDGNIRIIEDEP